MQEDGRKKNWIPWILLCLILVLLKVLEIHATKEKKPFNKKMWDYWITGGDQYISELTPANIALALFQVFNDKLCMTWAMFLMMNHLQISLLKGMVLKRWELKMSRIAW